MTSLLRTFDVEARLETDDDPNRPWCYMISRDAKPRPMSRLLLRFAGALDLVLVLDAQQDGGLRRFIYDFIRIILTVLQQGWQRRPHLAPRFARPSNLA